MPDRIYVWKQETFSMAQSSQRFEYIRQKVLGLERLPTLPQVILNIRRVIRDPSSNIKHIADAIQGDLSISSRFLKLANSVVYAGKTGPVNSVMQAIVRIGCKELENMLLTMSLVKIFRGTRGHINSAQLWRHSLAVAGASRALADFAKVDPEEAYTVGLLHDMGWLILDQFFPNLIENINNPGMRFVPRGGRMADTAKRSETEIVGADHGWVGGIVLEQWRLPTEVVEAVGWHHEPESAAPSGQKLAAVTHICDAFCIEAGFACCDTAGNIDMKAEFRKLSLVWEHHKDIIKCIVNQATANAGLIDEMAW
jgi:putative nucleotidyltransferase with HDIG domain